MTGHTWHGAGGGFTPRVLPDALVESTTLQVAAHLFHTDLCALTITRHPAAHAEPGPPTAVTFSLTTGTAVTLLWAVSDWLDTQTRHR